MVPCAAMSAAFILALAGPARSQTPPNALTADDAVQEALAANLDLAAARFAIDEAHGRLLQSGRLANPELEIAYADDVTFKSEGERTGSAGFAQSFPVTARLVRENDVARQDVAIADAEVRDFARRLVAEVQSAFYAVRTLDERIVVNRQLIDSVRHVENATSRRLEAAEVSPAEVGLLRIERLRLEQGARQLVSAREVAAASLTRLLGRTTPDGLTPVGDLDPGSAPSAHVPAAAAKNLVGRPDLDAAHHTIERAEADRALARAQVWEDWTVDLGYENERQVFDAPIGNKRDSFLTLGVKVPIPLWNRQQGRIATAEAVLARARRSRNALVLRIEEEIRIAEARVRTLRSSVDAYAAEILPEATRSQELFERGYGQGLIGIAELLQAQRQYNESRALYLELLGDLRQATIELEAAAGTSPHLNPSQSQRGTP
jgi:cobalt-zinc-cadmium efflux system outer membrane protein